MLSFTIDGDPHALQRHRTVRRGDQLMQFDPPGNRSAKGEVLTAWRQAGGRSFDRGTPLVVTVTCVFRRPNSHYGTGKNSGTLKLTAPSYRTGRPDCDNLLKLVGDALNGFCWHDDSQIVRAEVVKRFTEAGETPHTEVAVHEVLAAAA